MIDSNFLSFQRWHFFSLNLTCSISFEISADRLMILLKCHLFSLAPITFSLCHCFVGIIMMYTLCGFLTLSLVFQSMSWTCGLILPLVWGNSQPWFLQIASIDIPFFSSSHMTLIKLMSGCYCPIYGFLKFSVSFLYTLAWMFLVWPFFQFINSMFNHI